MIIQVTGMDPSLRNWGLATANLNLETGVMDDPVLALVQTGDEPKGKQVRTNSYDLEAAETLMRQVYPVIESSKAVFVEVPHGSQSAAGMKGYGICIGILGAIRARGIPIIEVSEAESKKVFVGKRTATKDDMIQAARTLYPGANWPMYKEKGQMVLTASKAEHMADAIAAIHAGVHTPMFRNLMRLFAEV